MLRRMAALVTVLVTAGPIMTSVAVAAPVECPTAWVWNTGYQACVLTAGGGGGGGPGDPGGGGGSGGTRVCIWNGQEIPCQTADGYWVGPPHECYVKRASPQPPKSEKPPWPDDERGGAIYDCSKRYLAGNNNLDYQFWWPTAPAPAGADPAVLLAEAISRMGIRGIIMGSTPPMMTGRVGVIGFPTWLWAADRTAQTWGPTSASASAGAGYTVTARAGAFRVQWEMGNGDVVECRGPGTEWVQAYGKEDSPTCGYRYVDDGDYTVQAVTFWTLTWAGMGQSGTIPLALFSRGQISMGEVQAIRIK